MRIIAALFDSVEGACRARTLLLQEGIAHWRPCVSRCLTEDAVAAEAPGQSYENQTNEDPEWSRFGEAVRSAVCVVSLKVRSTGEAALAATLLRSSGARGGILRVPPLEKAV